MINSYFTQQAGFARIEDLRREAEGRRPIVLARGQRSQEAAPRRRRLGMRTLGTLRTRRPAAI